MTKLKDLEKMPLENKLPLKASKKKRPHSENQLSRQ